MSVFQGKTDHDGLRCAREHVWAVMDDRDFSAV